MRARAQRQKEVRDRITRATVHLHGSVGPARTTISDIAKLAGVRRATVYNHFATDEELLDACSSHWFTENPPPDPSTWVEISDPDHRIETALLRMYEYYDGGQEMLEKVLGDAHLVPALKMILEQKWEPLLEEIVTILEEGRASFGDTELRASLRVALNFFTWRTLAAAGLSKEKAARLAASWIKSLS
ncbi:MAG: TetR/AcrR family transcriptional regulator [Desulfocapsaceae bacterium]